MNASANQPEGSELVRSSLPRPQVEVWLHRIDERYEALASVLQRAGPEAVQSIIGPGQRYIPTASSMTIGAVLSEEDIANLVGIIANGPTGDWIRARLGGSVACNLTQSWVRRQYAPAHYPRWHAPHGWHQDGALGFDFQNCGEAEIPPDAILAMVTCWIAMTPSGADAPGLELVQQGIKSLSKPPELADSFVQSRFGAEDFWRPVLQAGDALLFSGDVLHRTHVTPTMTSDRSSIELRFFLEDRIPARLKDDPYLALRHHPAALDSDPAQPTLSPVNTARRMFPAIHQS